jgi:hypothetical protein
LTIRGRGKGAMGRPHHADGEARPMRSAIKASKAEASARFG